MDGEGNWGHWQREVDTGEVIGEYIACLKLNMKNFVTHHYLILFVFFFLGGTQWCSALGITPGGIRETIWDTGYGTQSDVYKVGILPTVQSLWSLDKNVF